MLAPKGKHVELAGEVVINEALTAPVEAGQLAGEVIYTWEGAEVGRSQLIVPEGVERASATEMMERLFARWFFADESR